VLVVANKVEMVGGLQGPVFIQGYIEFTKTFNCKSLAKWKIHGHIPELKSMTLHEFAKLRLHEEDILCYEEGVQLEAKCKSMVSKRSYGQFVLNNPEVTPLAITRKKPEFALSYCTLKRNVLEVQKDIKLEIMPKLGIMSSYRGIWVHGDGGLGKTSLIRHIYNGDLWEKKLDSDS
jgi:hypothetical protein